MPQKTTLVLLTLLLLSGCYPALKLSPSDAHVVLARQLLDAPNPARRGSHSVGTLFYGSGKDRRRPEYRDSVSLTTDSVDASKLVRLGDRASSRNRYWGFSPAGFPINGRVWYPDGDGPFPLVLIVHGNHNPRDFSDPGYGYLGELLASRGFIFVSVDMNFLNGGLRGENDARGWLLLKHLETWRAFHETAGNPFFGMVDMTRIALIGHSRGGEAVGHAAAFNRLRFYPDDASLEFQFGFGIRSIIAIAPVDGQYLPTGRPVPLEDVNYMVFHGSHDGDVTSFHGLRQYHRVSFTNEEPLFKTAVYVYRANHGQWNTVWNNKDNGPRSGRILDLRPLLEPEEQREFGMVYLGAFLAATLQDDDRYLPMFRDHRVVGEWLPKTMYITRYQTSSFNPVADFEEDIDVTTGSAAGVVLQGDSLQSWREGRLKLRSRNRSTTSGSQENQAVWLGWNYSEASDSTYVETPPAFSAFLPDGFASEWKLDEDTALEFLLAPTGDIPERRGGVSDQSAESAAGESKGERSASSSGSDDQEEPIDLTVVVEDALGESAALPLSRYGPIRRPLEIHILRRRDLERGRYSENYDLVLQSYSILLRDFLEENREIDLSRLRSVRWVFDRTATGTVVLDDVGFARLPLGFTRVDGARR